MENCITCIVWYMCISNRSDHSHHHGYSRQQQEPDKKVKIKTSVAALLLSIFPDKCALTCAIKLFFLFLFCAEKEKKKLVCWAKEKMGWACVMVWGKAEYWLVPCIYLNTFQKRKRCICAAERKKKLSEAWICIRFYFSPEHPNTIHFPGENFGHLRHTIIIMRYLGKIRNKMCATFTFGKMMARNART